MKKFPPKNNASQKRQSFNNKEGRSHYASAEKTGQVGEAARVPNTILYGYHACFEALGNKSRHVKIAYLGQGLESDNALMERIHNRHIKIEWLQRNDFDDIGLRGTVHQNIALRVEPLVQPSIEALIHKITQKNAERSILVMLDQVTDPHNIGAIMRSACAFGSDGMIVQDRNAPELNALIAKTACGAVEHLPYIHETNLSRSIRYLQEEGYYCVGLDERGNHNLPAIAKQYDKICLVLGAEGQGLRRLVGENCDVLVALPTQAPIQSLNVSNAAAVALYALIA